MEITYTNERLGFELLKDPEDFRNERLERLKTIADCDQNDDGNGQCLEVLLELDVLIGSQQGVENRGGFPEERPISKARPAHFGNGADVVTNESVDQRPRQ